MENLSYMNLDVLANATRRLQLDKASIIRLTTSYLKMRAVFPDGMFYFYFYLFRVKIVRVVFTDGCIECCQLA